MRRSTYRGDVPQHEVAPTDGSHEISKPAHIQNVVMGGSIKVLDDLCDRERSEQLLGLDSIQDPVARRALKQLRASAAKIDVLAKLQQAQRTFKALNHTLTAGVPGEGEKHVVLFSAGDSKEHILRGLSGHSIGPAEEGSPVPSIIELARMADSDPVILDVPECNVPRLCKIFVGDREQPAVRFLISEVTADGRRGSQGGTLDLCTYVSTECKQPSASSRQGRYPNQTRFTFSTRTNEANNEVGYATIRRALGGQSQEGTGHPRQYFDPLDMRTWIGAEKRLVTTKMQLKRLLKVRTTSSTLPLNRARAAKSASASRSLAS